MEGNDSFAPTPSEPEGYVFIGWDTANTNITADVTIKPLYKKLNVIESSSSDEIVDGTIFYKKDSPVTVSASAYTQEAASFMLAEYDGNTLVRVIDATCDENSKYTVSADINPAENSSIKIMLWNSDGMSPLSSAQQIKFEEISE